ncbi:MAG: hypothetical protein M3Q07_07910 [Pseudobdellovibrionaceae bacterium]|nr:hypothetical protein [Pseudobdellovibrionaceae bacterium]
MNFIPKLLRILLGLFMILNAGVGLFMPIENAPMSPETLKIVKSFWDTGYLMHVVKLIELIVGLLLTFGLYVPLALIIFAPILFNIFLLHIFYEPLGLTLSLPMTIIVIVLARQNWDSYRLLFNR